MDILSVVNFIKPGTIERLALSKDHCSNGFDWVGYNGVYVVITPGAILPNDDELKSGEIAYNEFVEKSRIESLNAERDKNIFEAMQKEADPLFFKEQRGEIPQGTWLAKVQEIKERFPKV
jgi:hypothetical protein